MQQLFEIETDTSNGYAQVALEQGIDAVAGGLTYAIPKHLSGLAVGDRVLVPLGRGNRSVAGYVVAIADDADVPNVKAIFSRDKQSISLTEDLMSLAHWIGAYYCCPLGMVLSTMLPAAVKRGTGTIRQLMVGLSNRAGDPPPDDVRLTRLQRTVLDTAQRLAGEGRSWIEIKELAEEAGARTVSSIKHLIGRRLLVTQQQSVVRSDAGAWQQTDLDTTMPHDLVLNADQQHAVDQLVAGIDQGFNVHLLHGVTGSGKTEVYSRVSEQLLANNDNRGVIVLVPEIVLTPQIAGIFHKRFADNGVALLHSSMKAAYRHEQWRRIRRGEIRIVVGARSAIFAPMPNVGLIIVDEEQEQSYKQDQLPRYHGRDVAIKRAQLLNIPIILGSATPSLESYYNAINHEQLPESLKSQIRHPKSDISSPRRYHYLRLPKRVADLKLPEIEIIDMTQERRNRYQMTGQAGVHLLSLRLETLLRQTLEAGGQTILLLNRRGYANYIACPDHGCGWLMNCNDCDTTVVYHKNGHLATGGYVSCHRCNVEQLLPRQCPDCGKRLTVFGLGTQRVEEELERKFSDTTVVRMDSDSMRTGCDYCETLERFRSGKVNILLGTQMVAKGLDFPNVRLVGVISGDTALHFPDFRASERTFQLIAQVAGRAGRGKAPGQVVVQSFNSNDPAIVLAARHDYETFARRELQLRQEVGLPPVTRMARIVVRDRDLIACIEQAKKLAGHLEAFNQQLECAVRMRGPAPCAIARIAGFYRQQIELIARDAGSLQKLMTALRNAQLLHSDARTAVDVDPVDLL